ncbi:MAG TPA: hypothetical protein VMS31_23130 [Pyrinomonadaceae bacterium]|nr:hypothetical protein [Pyrinomonadaceae bacterium]
MSSLTIISSHAIKLASHPDAKTLCRLAAEIKALAPWTLLQETEVFGVEDPDTGEIGFISVMGNIGEFESVAVYSGAEGIYGFIDFQFDDTANPDRLIEIPQIQLSFSEPKFLEKRDRELLKASGVKFTGTKPQFRSFRPGYLPWFITLGEARLLIHALSQTVEMTKRLASEPVSFPDDGDDETEPFLVRVPRHADSSREPDTSRKGDTELVWEDQIRRIPRPAESKMGASAAGIDSLLLSDLQTLPLSTNQLEADVFIGPGRIGEPDERPLALYMLILADRFSGYILGIEALSAELSLDAMYEGIPEKIAQLLWQKKVLPKQIIVRTDRLLNLLEPLESKLKIQLRRAKDLPAIDEAVASMTQFLKRGKI